MFPCIVQHFGKGIVVTFEFSAEQVGREGNEVQRIDFVTSFQVTELEITFAVVGRLAVQVVEVL